ncbi:DUF1097 domain-containing protein [Methylobrevis albus]|uniref:DUF1097 domain-containing protein n=1 Tax=Methylobrevis albus TaxID=2793297 RepID=A0A931HZP6_9HYPH|nr:DUF1097 domain-containing protein [Methylobrevis albus]MBH0236323.1 DUF1097 domain-containing protein [Methylobrevis albus]
MNLVTALAVVIGVLGAIATYLFLGPAGGLGLQIWAAFIAWGSFFHCGGNEAALKSSVIANLWGSVWATIAFALILNVGIGELPLNAAVWVGVTVALMILGAHLPLFGAIPAAVYGYAATAGFIILALFVPGTLSNATLFSLVPGQGPFITIGLSMIIGALFGLVSGKIAGALAK